MRLAQTTPDLSALSDAIDTDKLGWWEYARSAIIVVAAIALGRVGRMLIRRLMARTSADDFLGDLMGRILGYVIVSFGLIYALESLGIAIAPVLGALGIAGIALAFALQDILANFVAGIILQFRRPFASGDEVVSNDYEGTIVEIDARTVTMLTLDGETVRLPSSEVIKHPIVNHTQNGRRRTSVEVGVAYGTDLDHAAEVARHAASEADGVMTSPAPEVFVEAFGDSSIDLVVRFWHGPAVAERWRTRDAVNRSIAVAFSDESIEIPFPQRVIHAVGAGPDDD